MTSGAVASQSVKVRSSSLTRTTAPQSNGNLVTPDSPRSDIVVKSRKPSARIPSSNDEQVVNPLTASIFSVVNPLCLVDVMVRSSDLQSAGRWFDCQSFRCHVTTWAR